MRPAACNLRMTVDSVAGNVHDLASVLAAVRDLTGLKPFLRFELELDSRESGHLPVHVRVAKGALRLRG